MFYIGLMCLCFLGLTAVVKFVGGVVFYQRERQTLRAAKTAHDARAASVELAVSKLPTRRWQTGAPGTDGREDVDDDECSICLVPFVRGDELRRLPCGHDAFHKDCVDKWLLNNRDGDAAVDPVCPLCKQPAVHVARSVAAPASSAVAPLPAEADGLGPAAASWTT